MLFQQPQDLDPSNDKLSMAGWNVDGGRADAVPPSRVPTSRISPNVAGPREPRA